jgi:hypothetical protein
MDILNPMDPQDLKFFRSESPSKIMKSMKWDEERTNFIIDQLAACYATNEIGGVSSVPRGSSLKIIQQLFKQRFPNDPTLTSVMIKNRMFHLFKKLTAYKKVLMLRQSHPNGLIAPSQWMQLIKEDPICKEFQSEDFPYYNRLIMMYQGKLINGQVPVLPGEVLAYNYSHSSNPLSQSPQIPPHHYTDPAPTSSPTLPLNHHHSHHSGHHLVPDKLNHPGFYLPLQETLDKLNTSLQTHSQLMSELTHQLREISQPQSNQEDFIYQALDQVQKLNLNSDELCRAIQVLTDPSTAKAYCILSHHNKLKFLEGKGVLKTHASNILPPIDSQRRSPPLPSSTKRYM